MAQNHIICWEEDEDNSAPTVEAKVTELINFGWNIISICVTEFRTNGIKERPTKAIIICQTS